MTSEELADTVAQIVESVRYRIVNVGSAEYDQGTVQKIETKSSDQLIQEAIEELDDLVVYCAYLRFRLSSLRTALE